MSSIYDPVFAVVAQGVKRTVLGGQIYEYGAGDYLVVSVELPVTGRVLRATPQHPFLAFGLMLDADLLDPVVRLRAIPVRERSIA